MKKIILCLLTIICLFGVIGCSNSNKNYSIGDTMINDNWEVTLKSAEFVDFMNLETDTLGRHGGENFGSTTIEPTDKKYKLEGVNGNALLVYTFEFKYTGKETYKDHFSTVGSTRVMYDTEYSFSENYFNFVKDNKGKWIFLNNDYNALKGVSILQNMYSTSGEYKPLDDTIYFVKGVIAVPEKVKNDTEAPLTIQFADITDKAFTIR